MGRKAKFGIGATVVTLIALVLGFLSGGAGHGDYVLARILLPFACATIALPLIPGAFVFIIAVVQWPTYFFGVYQICKRGGNVSRFIIFLAAIHVSLALLTFTVLNGPFSQ